MATSIVAKETLNQSVLMMAPISQMAAFHSPFYAETLNLVELCERIGNLDYPPLSSRYFSDGVSTLDVEYRCLDLQGTCTWQAACELNGQQWSD